MSILEYILSLLFPPRKLPEKAKVIHIAPVPPPPPPPQYFSRKDVLQGREVEYPLTPELEANLAKLLVAIESLHTLWGKPMRINSGYRPGRWNVQAGGAKNSAHLHCMAADFADPKGELDAWLMANPSILKDLGLWLEHPNHTPGWSHCQIRPVGSDPDRRVFLP